MVSASSLLSVVGFCCTKKADCKHYDKDSRQFECDSNRIKAYDTVIEFNIINKITILVGM